MDHVQLLLTGGKGLSDICVCDSPQDNAIILRLGLPVVERFFRDPRTLLYKMAIGRLANMKFPLREIERIFGHDHRTVTSWAQGLKVLDPAQFLRIYSGQGALPKVDAVLECFVRTKYRELRGEARDFRVRIPAPTPANRTWTPGRASAGNRARVDGQDAGRDYSILQHFRLSSTPQGHITPRTYRPLC